LTAVSSFLSASFNSSMTRSSPFIPASSSRAQINDRTSEWNRKNGGNLRKILLLLSSRTFGGDDLARE
jgi:hypothetical protein